MIIYYVLLLLVISCCLISSGNQQRELFFGVLAWGAMLILSGLRSVDFNGDTAIYIQTFNRSYIVNDIVESHEVLFYSSMFLFRNPNLWLLFISVLIYTPLIFITKSETKLCCLAALIYMISASKFFTESFNIIRQSIAASIILWSFVENYKGHSGKTLILWLISILFHLSSLIIGPFYFIKRINVRRLVIYLLVTSTFLIGILGNYSQEIISMIFDIIGDNNSQGGLLGDIFMKYSAYSRDGVSFNQNFIMATCFPIVLMVLFTYPQSRIQRSKYGYYYYILAFSSCLANIITPATQFGFRVTFSPLIVQILVYPLAFQYASKKRKIGLILLLFLFIIIYLHTLPTLMPNYKIL